jgi:ferredoxin
MVKRNIITIDEDKCTGCGLCIPNCHEGALKIIDGKARLVSDLFCDGLGACIGHCPEGAISIEKREAKPYDERKVMENIIKAGPNTIKAHLEHLRDHNEEGYFTEAIKTLKEKGVAVPQEFAGSGKSCVTSKHHPCPGAATMDFQKTTEEEVSSSEQPSQLRQWPIQLHLVSPIAPYYEGADVMLAADCVAYALGGFHAKYLKGKSLAIACPKLDERQDVYAEKIKSWLEDAKINTLTVIIMQVPCCMGLLHLAKKALEESKRKVPIKCVVVGLQGEILKEEWV